MAKMRILILLIRMAASADTASTQSGEVAKLNTGALMEFGSTRESWSTSAIRINWLTFASVMRTFNLGLAA